MPPDVEVKPGWHAFIKSMQRPGSCAGVGQPGDREEHLGKLSVKYTE
jgi:hypothetical protein